MVSLEKTICRVSGQPVHIIQSGAEKTFVDSRVGPPSAPLLPDANTGSVVTCYGTSNPNMKVISRLSMYNGMPYKTPALMNIFRDMAAKCSRHNISNKIVEEAQQIYKRTANYRFSTEPRTHLITSAINRYMENLDLQCYI
eukprot:SAG31_NODE_1724_length_7442_cov_3.433533_2_plen_141_part_00